MNILEVQNLSFSLDAPILEDISFEIEEGSFTIITGANGAGKSFLLKCIKGLVKPSSGRIMISGEDVTKDRKKRLSEIGLVFQDADAQIVAQTVEKDIRFGMENLSLDEKEQEQRLNQVLELMNLDSKRRQRPHTLSGGEKRRLAIAGILAMKPRVIIMDEPFANLDYPGVQQVIRTLLLLKEQKYTIMIVSHEIEKVAAHADGIILLDKGRLVLHDTVDKALPHLREHGVFVPPLEIEEMTWLP